MSNFNIVVLEESQAKELYQEDEGVIGGMSLELKELGDWEESGKYSYLSNCIYVDKLSGKHFRLDGVSKSGSYFTDYHFEFGDCSLVEVEEQEVKTVQWVALKFGGE